MQINQILLANGVSMPTVGLGTYQMNKSNLEIALPAALDAGYRSFDTAASYKNEHYIGEIFRHELSKRGLSRKDIFITTKLRPADQGYEKAIAAVCKSASLLGGYIDLYLIHWPGAAKVKPTDDMNRVRRIETWRALQDVYNLHLKVTNGEDNSCSDHSNSNDTRTNSTVDNTSSQASLSISETNKDLTLYNRLNGVFVRAIGVSNFNISHIESLVTSPHFEKYPHVNQCEIHPGYHPQDLRTYCNLHNIHLQAYSSLGCGKLLEKKFLDCFPRIHDMARKRSVIFSKMSRIENVSSGNASVSDTYTHTCTVSELESEPGLEAKNSSSDDASGTPITLNDEKNEDEEDEEEEKDEAVLKSCTVGVYLRWAIQHGYSIIPKSCNPQRIRDNYVMATTTATAMTAAPSITTDTTIDTATATTTDVTSSVITATSTDSTTSHATDSLVSGEEGFQLSLEEMDYLNSIAANDVHVCEKLCWDGSQIR